MRGQRRPHSIYSEGLLVGYRWYTPRTSRRCSRSGSGSRIRASGISGSRRQRTPLRGLDAASRVTNTGAARPGPRSRRCTSAIRGDGEPPEQLFGFQRVSLSTGQDRRGDDPAGTPCLLVLECAPEAMDREARVLLDPGRGLVGQPAAARGRDPGRADGALPAALTSGARAHARAGLRGADDRGGGVLVDAMGLADLDPLEPGGAEPRGTPAR